MSQTDPIWHRGVDAAGAKVLAALTRRPGLRREVRAWRGNGFMPYNLYTLLKTVWDEHPDVPQKRDDLHQLCRIYAQHPLQLPAEDHQRCTRFPTAVPEGSARQGLAEALRTGTPEQVLRRMTIAAKQVDEPICPSRIWKDVRTLRYNATTIRNTTVTAATLLRQQWLYELEGEKQ